MVPDSIFAFPKIDLTARDTGDQRSLRFAAIRGIVGRMVYAVNRKLFTIYAYIILPPYIGQSDIPGITIKRFLFPNIRLCLSAA